MLRRTIFAMVLTGFCGLLLSGCVFHVVDPGPPVEYGYQPLLYNGYVVYYSDVGVPFYWSSGVRVFIPLAYRTHYIDHWHLHRASYLRWHQHRGHHYRSRHYKGRSHRTRRHDSSPARSKPTLTPKRGKRGSSKPSLMPKRGKRGSSKPTLEPKKKEKKKEKKKKKKKKKKKATLKPKK